MTNRTCEVEGSTAYVPPVDLLLYVAERDISVREWGTFNLL
jgi:hypothetical protein